MYVRRQCSDIAILLLGSGGNARGVPSADNERAYATQTSNACLTEQYPALAVMASELHVFASTIIAVVVRPVFQFNTEGYLAACASSAALLVGESSTLHFYKWCLY